MVEGEALTTSASDTRDNTVGVGMHMGNVCEVQSVTTLEEECHASDEAKHGRMVLGVGFADDDQEDTSNDTISVEKDSLRPHVLGFGVGEISDDTAEWSESNVQQAEHGSPVAFTLETKTGEVAPVVVSEDAVLRNC